MIIGCTFRNTEYKFINENEQNNNDNIFTVIVGKNGTGKSTLLSSLINSILKNSVRHFISQDQIGIKLKDIKDLDVNVSNSNIIAVSSSPFDKFPLTRRMEELHNYSYLGLRDLSALNFGLSYMSKIISSVLEVVLKSRPQWNNITRVLGYLGYHEALALKLSPNFPKSVIQKIIESNFDEDFLLEYSKLPGRRLNRRFFFDDEGNKDRKKIMQLREILKDLYSNQHFLRSREFQFVITNQYYTFEGTEFKMNDEMLIFALKSGIFYLKDIELVKRDHKRPTSIIHSSSGEQSVLLNILGIAARIKDNSLIFIDEPEVCLHPEWQERYIQILLSTFNDYKNCHFIIATHSPQIVANLNDNNCYVVSMENGDLINAKNIVNNSADYQLANVFKSPGFKNEYLSRISLSLITRIAKNKKFEIDDYNEYEILRSSFDLLENNDPVRQLISLIKKLHKKYA